MCFRRDSQDLCSYIGQYTRSSCLLSYVHVSCAKAGFNPQTKIWGFSRSSQLFVFIGQRWHLMRLQTGVVCVKPRRDRPRAIRITGELTRAIRSHFYPRRLRNLGSTKKYHIWREEPLSGNRTQLSHERTSESIPDGRRAHWPIYLEQRRWILGYMAGVEPGSGNAWWPYIGRVWCKTSIHKKDRFTMATTNLSASESNPALTFPKCLRDWMRVYTQYTNREAIPSYVRIITYQHTPTCIVQ